MAHSPRRDPLWPWILAVAALAWATADGRLPRQQQPVGSGAFGTRRSADEPRHAHLARAAEPDRGRRAGSPFRIPMRGWGDILRRTFNKIGENRLMAVAAGVAFYSLLALFPALTALVSMYGIFTDPNAIVTHLQVAQEVLPPGAFEIVGTQVERIASRSQTGLTFTVLIGLAVALWSANAATKAVFDALNVVYEEDEKRSFIRLNIVTLAFTLGAIVFFLLAVLAVIVVPIVLGFIGLQGEAEYLLNVLRWPALLVVMVLALGVVYRFGPSRRGARWQWLSVGSVFATLAWLAVSLGFS